MWFITAVLHAEILHAGSCFTDAFTYSYQPYLSIRAKCANII